LIGIVFPKILISIRVKIPRAPGLPPVFCQIISNKKLPFNLPKDAIVEASSNFECVPAPTRVILHIHGGGFIAGSPRTHEPYLRDWSISTGSLLISVDYSLAPEQKYPTQLNECFDVYRWIVSDNDWGLKANSIIITGDSSGGNLAVTTTVKAILENCRVPDGLWVAYPALDLRLKVSTSRAIFINDVMLPIHFMKICLNSYLHKTDDATNPLISPVNANDEILKKFPQFITIVSAGMDPLLDDCIKFIRRLESNQILYQHKVYELLPHGFLNYATTAIPESWRAKNDSIVMIETMFQQIEKKKFYSTQQQQ